MTDLSPETVERMVALVRSVAQYVPQAFTEVAEARAIVRDLPAPVDPDLVEARRIAQYYFGDINDFVGGRGDRSFALKATLAAIKRGRALERGEAR